MSGESGVPEAPSPSERPRRVGFWFTDKKRCQMKVEEHFGKQCQIHGMELVKIRLDECLESQGPFCAIVHKISDLMVLGEQGDAQAEAACRNLEDYACRHPETVIIDPLPNVRLLSNRHRMFKATESVNTISESVFTPSFVELTTNNIEDNLLKLREHDVKFPLVCKPLPSHGSSRAHQMCLIFGAQGLKDVQAPCVAQTFICHGAVLYKIFVVGKDYHVVDRPSLKNFQAGDGETIFFNSHDVSKHPRPSSWITKLDQSDVALQQSSLPPAKSRLDEIVGLLQRKLGLDLFGIDIIVQTGTGNCAVIDVNTFPGYTEVSGLWESVCQLILRTLSTTYSMKTIPNKDTLGSSVQAVADDQSNSSVSCGLSEDPKNSPLRTLTSWNASIEDQKNTCISEFLKTSGIAYQLNSVAADTKFSNKTDFLEEQMKPKVTGTHSSKDLYNLTDRDCGSKVIERNHGKNCRKNLLSGDQQKKMIDGLTDDTDHTSRITALKKSRSNTEIPESKFGSEKIKGGPDVADVLKDSREDSGIDTSDSCDEKKNKKCWYSWETRHQSSSTRIIEEEKVKRSL